MARAGGSLFAAIRAVPLCLFTVILKREALKVFHCASTVKAVMENTGKVAGDGLLPCFALKYFYRAIALKSRFAQHDIKSENGNALKKL